MNTLNKLAPGQVARVVNIGDVNRRLKDLGLIEGTLVKCVLKSPLGDPKAYNIRGAIVAIRKEEGEKIQVEVTECES